MLNRSAVTSQIRSSRVTLKRVTTNQPEKIVTASAPQAMPIHLAREIPDLGISGTVATMDYL